MGDKGVRVLAVAAERMRLVAIAAARLLTAVAGGMGWVGLAGPHLARMLTGSGSGRLLPTSAPIGAGDLLPVDTAARMIAEIEVPLGILTAVVDASVFIWLLASGRRGCARRIEAEDLAIGYGRALVATGCL